MSTYDIPHLDAKGLRNFALTTGAIVAVLFGLLLPVLLALQFRAWPWALAAALCAWGLTHPTSLEPVYRLWMRFGLLLSRITTPLILALVFFLVFAPVALAMRLFGRDTMSRRIEPERVSYRKAVRPRDAKSMENPF